MSATNDLHHYCREHPQKDPDKFGDVVILSNDDYEEYEAYQEMLAAEAEANAGDVITMEEYFQHLDDLVTGLKK